MKGSDYLLIKSQNECPKCFVRRSFVTGFCHNCGVKLFTTVFQDFGKFEAETLIRNWWAYDVERGWMFRDHFMVASAKALVRVQPIDKKALDKNYGRQTTPEEAAIAPRLKENRVRHRRSK